MSWTWAGFWKDDPVFRYKGEEFFQSGRHKAEERFWKNYIHQNGSQKLIYKLRDISEKEEEEKENQSKKEQEEKKEKEDVEKEEKKEKEDVEKEENEYELKVQELERRKREMDFLLEDLKRFRRSKYDDDISEFTCASCSRCIRKPGSADILSPPIGSPPKLVYPIRRKEPVQRLENLETVYPQNNCLTASASNSQERWSSRVG